MLAVLALALTGMLLVASLAIDLALAGVASSNLSRAVGAAALSGARHAGKGLAGVRRIVERVGAANGVARAAYSVEIDSYETDTYQVTVAGDAESPAIWWRLAGKDSIEISARAQATRYPVDLSLVLDLSVPLGEDDAFERMRESARHFLDQFDGSIDRVGLVGCSPSAQELLPLRRDFHAAGGSVLDAITPMSDADLARGLRSSKEQLDAAPMRNAALRAIVVLTDGTSADTLDAAQSKAAADAIRDAGYTIYVVALRSGDADPYLLRFIANHRGITNAGQPAGEALFSATPADLDTTVADLADRILTRLTL